MVKRRNKNWCFFINLLLKRTLVATPFLIVSLLRYPFRNKIDAYLISKVLMHRQILCCTEIIEKHVFVRTRCYTPFSFSLPLVLLFFVVLHNAANNATQVIGRLI